MKNMFLEIADFAVTEEKKSRYTCIFDGRYPNFINDSDFKFTFFLWKTDKFIPKR
jgi:hypothetical protein